MKSEGPPQPQQPTPEDELKAEEKEKLENKLNPAEIPDSDLVYSDRIKNFSGKVADETGLKTERIRYVTKMPEKLEKLLKVSRETEKRGYYSTDYLERELSDIVIALRKITDNIYPSLFTGIHTLGGDLGNNRPQIVSEWVKRRGIFQDLEARPGAQQTESDNHFKFFYVHGELGGEYRFLNTPAFCINAKNPGLRIYYENLIENLPAILIESLALKEERHVLAEDGSQITFSPFDSARLKHAEDAFRNLQEVLLLLADQQFVNSLSSSANELDERVLLEKEDRQINRSGLRLLLDLENEQIEASGGVIDKRKLLSNFQSIYQELSLVFDKLTESVRYEGRLYHDYDSAYFGARDLDSLFNLWGLANGRIVVGSFFKPLDLNQLDVSMILGLSQSGWVPVFRHPCIKQFPKFCNVSACMLDLYNKKVRFFNS